MAEEQNSQGHICFCKYAVITVIAYQETDKGDSSNTKIYIRTEKLNKTIMKSWIFAKKDIIK